MHDSPSIQAGNAAPATRRSRRAIVSWAVKLAGGTALAATIPGSQWVQLAAAQDDEIILTAAASEVGARPGSAYATGAAAMAAGDHEAGGFTGTAASSGGSGAGPGDSSGAGPGSQSGASGGGAGGGTGAGPGGSTGSGPGGGGGGGGGGTGSGSGTGGGGGSGTGGGGGMGG